MQCNCVYLADENDPVLFGDRGKYVAVFIFVGFYACGEAWRGFHFYELVRGDRDRLFPYPRLEGVRRGNAVLD